MNCKKNGADRPTFKEENTNKQNKQQIYVIFLPFTGN
jgi:hypothetical protein